MPWDASRLLVVPLARRPRRDVEYRLARVQRASPWWSPAVPTSRSGQPGWGRDGRLRFVSDRAGWWQPYRDADPAPERLRRHGRGVPRPRLGSRAVDPGRAARRDPRCPHDRRRGATRWSSSTRPPPRAGRAGPAGRAPHVVLEQPCVSIAAVCEHQGGLALIGTTPDAPSTVWIWRDEARCPPGPPPGDDCAAARPTSPWGSPSP